MNIQDKKEILKNKAVELITLMINKCEDIDHMEILIKFHEGTIHFESTDKRREKAY